MGSFQPVVFAKLIGAVALALVSIWLIVKATS
jgi:hypothetical protein